MPAQPLQEAEEALKHGVASIDDILDAYGPAIVRQGELPELVDLAEASPGGREAVARWIRRADFQNGGPPAEEGGDPLAGIDLVNLADFLEDPEALQPPETVAAGMAYRGHTTLFFGDPKGGKTTSAVALGAAVSDGAVWMSQPTDQGPVLYLAAEGNRRQILRRHHEFGARPEAVDVVVPGMKPVAELRALLRFREYRLVVIDTLGKWMAPLEVDRWKQSDVDTVLNPLERMIRESGAALVAIHHANSEGKPIDSTGFAAWADLLRRVEDGQSERERVVTGRARFDVPDLRFRLVEDEVGSSLIAVDRDREMDELILEFVDDHPDASKRQIRDGVGGDNAVIDDRLDALVADGLIDRDTSGRAHTHKIAENPHQHAASTVQHGNQHGGAGHGGEHRAGGEEKGDYSPPSSPSTVPRAGEGEGGA